MKRGISTDRILSILLHPAFLAIPFFALLIIHTNFSFSPNKLSILESQPGFQRGVKSVYVDLNSDTRKEFLIGYNLVTNATVLAYNEGQAIYEAWNLRGYWINDQPSYELMDLDEDGRVEMYALTISPGDSLWINQLELKKGRNIIQSRFICRLSRFNEKLDHDLSLSGFDDINNDGKKEVLFFISAGFTLQPRAIYAWDICRDTIIRTEYSGINYKRNENVIVKNDEANRPYLFLKTVSTDNYKTDVPFPDTACYAVVLTEQMDYLFDPVITGGRQAFSQTYPFYRGDSMLILALVTENRKSENKRNFILLDKEGNILEKHTSEEFDGTFQAFRVNEELMILRRNEKVSELGTFNSQFRFLKKKSFRENLKFEAVLNIDDDEYEELFFTDPENNDLIIIQENLRDYAKVELPPFEPGLFYPSLMRKNKDEARIYIQTSNAAFKLEHTPNRYYKFRFLIYILIYSIIFSFFLGLQKIFVYSNNRRRNREQKLLNYQLQSVMNQLNPHFTFNAINSIGYAIMEGKKDEAYDYFTKLSGLIRRSMKNAFIPYKSLAEEINFVKDYLEIEKYRFGVNLSWDINTANDVDLTIPVPKMLIHIFVENSIKHGLFHLEGIGRIDIRIMKVQEYIEISVRDNGIGYEPLKSVEEKGGKGLLILDNYLEIYNATTGNYINYKIFDRQPVEGKRGTCVIITIK